ncbi:DUF4345 domain-containing protein [uncultured Umboniibacter sp.]|uniref:DUF4345 domain-containing protein n=1 Tax=uncultured Umboniibacter sp. TaxID=1798917 RepID=UPI002611AD9D|nr:DUF4345 domain-containing protein [uncultured Umboniibacter sp.]
MNLRQMFLLLVSVSLFPIALSYGVAPQESLHFLFGMTVTDINAIHIYRAMMGLYLAMSVFWFIGAFNVLVRQAALYSQIVFMSGVAAGRAISLIVDGMPHWLMLVYLTLEIIAVMIGVLLLSKVAFSPVQAQQTESPSRQCSGNHHV